MKSIDSRENNLRLAMERLRSREQNDLPGLVCKIAAVINALVCPRVLIDQLSSYQMDELKCAVNSQLQRFNQSVRLHSNEQYCLYTLPINMTLLPMIVSQDRDDAGMEPTVTVDFKSLSLEQQISQIQRLLQRLLPEHDIVGVKIVGVISKEHRSEKVEVTAKLTIRDFTSLPKWVDSKEQILNLCRDFPYIMREEKLVDLIIQVAKLNV